MRYIITGFILAFLVAVAANASTFSWTPPTSFEDGSVLNPSSDLDSYILTCVGKSTITKVLPLTPTSWTSPNGLFPVGTYDCSMQSVATLANGGGTSVKGTIKKLVILHTLPSPIQSFTIR